MEQKKKSIMFYEICRLCLDEHGYCCIYEKDGLSADIYMCTGVKVTPADNLPQRICKNCLNIVNMATELRKKAKRNQCHLNSLFGGDDEKEITKESEDAMETVTSTHFEEKNNSPHKNNSAIENFLKVRMDLFEASVAEDSLVTSETTQLNSKQLKLNSKQKTSQKRKNHDNSNDEDEICETYCIIENSINMSESSQPDSSQSSQKPQSQKKTKLDQDGSTYECDVCSKKFNKYKKLYLHHRVHSKNLICPIDVCGKKFSTKADLQKHIRTHTGEKPYACDMCDKSFAQRGTLKAHKLSVHSAG